MYNLCHIDIYAFLFGISFLNGVESQTCDQRAILCSCSSEPVTIRYTLDMCNGYDAINKVNVCRPCNDHLLRGDLCQYIENCRSCLHDNNVCIKCPDSRYQSFCFEFIENDGKRSIADPTHEGLFKYGLPMELMIYRGQLLADDYILRASGCDLPSRLITANLRCVVNLDVIECVQSCIWGHTLPEGPQRIVKCDLSEQIWTPSPIEECKPFVDCHLKIVSPGEIECHKDPLYHGPACQLSCREYANKASVPPTIYRCLTTGEWIPPLPHCIEEDLSLELAPAPNNTQKDHEILTNMIV